VQFGTSSTAALRDTFTVLKDGDYGLETRYSVTGANINTIDLYVNGVKVADPVFTQTATLSDWGINKLNISLNAGVNTIELRAAGTGASSIYFDNMVVVPTVYGDGVVIQENESGFAGVDGTIDANQPGYTGAGFANTSDVMGAGVDWELTFNSLTTKSFTFRYASTNDRTADLIVDGVKVASNIQFGSTGSLSNWGFVTVYASVPAGDSAVRLQSTSATGLPNIDSLEVLGGEAWFPGAKPFTPVGVSATAITISQIDVQWWVTPGADTYNVKRASTSGGPYTTIATGVTGTSFSDTGTSALQTYYYVVSADNSIGESADSSETSASATAPSPPTGLAAVGLTFDTIGLSWTASPGADSYTVKRSITSGGPYTTVATGVTGTSHTDTGLSAGTTYYYVVSAINGFGESLNSSEAQAIPISEYQESGGVLSMEAEHGTVGSRWITTANATASGGQYIEINPIYNGTGSGPDSTAVESIATYDFQISTIGNYSFWFRIFGPTANDDSFFWRIDNGAWILENGRGGAGSWYSRDNVQTDSLAAGSHVLGIAYRENGTGLDKFVIQLDSATAPTGNGPPESPFSLAPSGLMAMAEPVASSFAGGSAGFAATPRAARSLTIESNLSEAEPISRSVRMRYDDELLIEAILNSAAMSRTESAQDVAYELLLSQEEGEGAEDWLDDLAAELVLPIGE
jgi:hypothetical protein